MKIGVVSDTHSLAIPKIVLEEFKKVDLIIHAGDFCSVDDLKIFSKIKEVKSVFGNMDELRLKKFMPEKLIFQVENISIGLYHGTGAPKNILEFMKDKFAKDKVNVVVFGHSHQALKEEVDNVLYFNPGSPNDTVRAPYRSYGMLTIDKGKVTAEIVKIS